ncbi:MAG: SPOR domain-containing protein [Bernardetiaceae bacterium]|nr:SPOR domain-containing protein [Bernardetiaceae bacterium]
MIQILRLLWFYLIANYLIFFPFLLFSSQIPHDFCVSEQELQLHQDINKLRNGTRMKGVIPLSYKLSYVARLHAQDIAKNYGLDKVSKGQGYYGWSSEGFWEECMVMSESPNACASTQAKAIIGYEAALDELVFYGKGRELIDFWRSDSHFSALLMQRGDWSRRKHRAMGVGVYKDIICIWIGDEADTLGAPPLCEGEVPWLTLKPQVADSISIASKSDSNDSTSYSALHTLDTASNDKQTITETTTSSYYLIFGSYKKRKNAKRALEQAKENGFEQAIILEADKIGYFRISLKRYTSLKEAKLEQQNLDSNKYTDAWILKE